MAELYVDGLTCKKIAEQFDCSLTKVYRTLCKLGVKMRPSAAVRKIPKKKHRSIVQCYESGRSCREIAEKFGCSKENIRDILQKHDVKMRPAHSHGWYSEDAHREMAEMYKQGHPRTHIAARFGCDPATLNRALHLQGVEIPSGPPRHFVTPAEREMIVNLHHQGVSRSEIAEKIGCVPQTIGEILHKLGVFMRIRSPDAYSAEDQQRIADLYEIGISIAEMTVGFHCGRKTIISILRKHGVKVRPRRFGGQVPPKVRNQMLTLYKECYSGAEIAAKLNCDIAIVASVIEFATRKSQIVQRIANMSKSQPPISLETLIRNFWADKARAVDALLLPPDLRLIITESVEQALTYAWNTLGNR